ncbi:MAG: hypothetical protein ACLT8T_13600 [Oscillospiraceae bacterium]
MKKSLALLLALALIFAFPVTASAAETTEAKVPVTLTVVNTVSPISCTVPAALPVSLIDGYVVCANNAAITNTAKTGSIKVTKVDVQAGTFEIGNFDDFTASKNSIALSINGCSTKGAGSLTLVGGAFPVIAAEKNLAIRYKAKVSTSEAVTNINAATVIFTIAAVNEKEAA